MTRIRTIFGLYEASKALSVQYAAILYPERARYAALQAKLPDMENCLNLTENMEKFS